MSDLTFAPRDADGAWPTVDPAGAGWNTEALSALTEWLGDAKTSQFLVLDHGRIVAQHFWHGAGPDTPTDIASAQKSIVGLVLGILIARGDLELDAPVSTWLGEGWTDATPEQEARVTLRHLITMTTGLDDDFAFEADAGTTWYYNNNAYHQARKVIERVTGGTTQDVCAELLFDPIGMADSTWQPRPEMTDPAGWVLSGLHTTARDLGRFGTAILAGGTWDGQDLGCDPGFLDASLRASQDLNPSYGILWWVLAGRRAIVPGLRPGDEWNPRKAFGGVTLDRPIAPAAPLDAVEAMGMGDQRVALVPSRQVVVVRLGRAAGEVTAAAGGFDRNFWERLAPALPEATE